MRSFEPGSRFFGHAVHSILHADLFLLRTKELTGPMGAHRENASCRAMCANGSLALDTDSTEWEGASNR